ncbi:NAD(P)-dependent oxidoreductase [Lactobacillus sp. ESL0731]|uniref:NAD(P)-dependent oxidoreductase n=1 Tax=unclassified Lactobacillus TaxID=2620435 RepID=UPI0023F9D277|nr:MULTISPECIES: NAD(P)-dependent oxidoreductase [unclassified Lactobacillus]WEV51460.1 NAD(P)-dependent oxidoreductase [Lactobacillus sp. ESL0700]WEV62589.1 NAD(P)-dependent oxidoreductase [Lactobacillus sp. ESL0731]
MLKIVAYGVRENEVAFFEKLNKYHYDLKLEQELLTHDNVATAKGADAVLLRANCVADAENLAKFHDWGIKYVFTRTVGFNHIDLKTCAKYGMKVARVPAYSPYAVAELALTLGMMLFRHLALATTSTDNGDFRVLPSMFSGEIHSGTVGIIGTGRIGATEAKLYHGFGTNVLAYDPYPSDYAKQFVTFVSQDELLAKSDIVSIHVPYFPGQNDKLIDATFLSKMKKSAVLVNTARTQLADYDAIITAVKNGTIAGFASDVLPNETKVMGQNFHGQITDPQTRQLQELYPQVLLTPHIGSYTSPALTDMIAVSYENFHQILLTGHTDNDVKLE